MSKYVVDGSDLTSLADAIRSKAGTSEPMTLTDMVSAIGDISGGGAFDINAWAYHSLSEINDVGGQIKGIGTATSTSQGYFPICNYQSMLTSINLPSCSYIGANGFAQCSSLSYISIPNCTSIMDYAFSSCVNFPSQLELPLCERVGFGAFTYCQTLESISIPQCSNISGIAFQSCTLLSYIYAPNCTQIQGNAFTNISTTKNIYISSHCFIASNCGQTIVSKGTTGKWLNYMSFNDNEYFCWVSCAGNSGTATMTLDSNCVTVASPVSIYNWNSPSLTTINLSNVVYIPSRAFSSIYARDYLKTIIGNSVTEIGESCFYMSQNYGSFAYLSFPMLESLPSYFVYGNSVWQRLISVTTSYLKYVGDYALSGANGLTYISLSKDCSYIGKYAFNGCNKMIINNSERLKITGLSSLNIYAFSNCSSITTMDLPNLESLGQATFSGCINLGAVRLENALSLGNGYTFGNCSRLSKLQMLAPSSVAVMGTTDLNNAGISKSTTLGYFGSIYTRASMVDDYKSATNWVLYSDRIVGMYSFGIGDATYWATMGSTYSQWVDDTFDNEDGYVVSDASLFTSDGTQYVVGMDLTSAIVDGATFQLSNI